MAHLHSKLKEAIPPEMEIKKGFLIDYEASFQVDPGKQKMFKDHFYDLRRLGIFNQTHKWVEFSPGFYHYPKSVLLPGSVGPLILKESGEARNGYFPVLIHIRGEAALLTARRSKHNSKTDGLPPLESGFQKRNSAMKKKPWNIVDVGKSYKVLLGSWQQTQFCEVPEENILDHFYEIETYLQSPTDEALKAKVDNGWIEDVKRIGRAAEAVKGYLLNGLSVVVQGTEKNHTYMSVASLAQLLIDPFYRTLEGFCVLINKDWVQFNYGFEATLGLGFKPSERTIPLFELFIYSVWVLTIYYPNAFAFNESVLRWIVTQSGAGAYAEFVAPPKIGSQKQATRRGVSAWDYILSEATKFSNPSFVETTEPLLFKEQVPLWGYYSSHVIPVAFWEITYRPNLREINLAKQNLFSIPKWVWTLPNMKILKLGSNYIQHGEHELAALELDFLDFSFNPMVFLQVRSHNIDISGIPHSAVEFKTNAKKLVWKDAQIIMTDSLASAFSQIPHLVLSNNAISSIPKTLSTTNILHLDLANNKIQRLILSPGSVTQYLDLRNNSLINVPDNIIRQPKLEYLDVSQNAIETLPDIRQLPLTTFLCSQNKLANIFEKNPFLSLPLRLQHLDLSGNKLTCLPKNLDALKFLVTLNLKDNQLRSLPLSIRSLVALRSLIVSHNKLRSIPLSVGNLVLLETLDISHNALSELPLSMGMLTQLKTFVWEGNKKIEDSLSNEHKALLANTPRIYFETASAANKSLFRTKLMVVGEENVGKTTTVRALSRLWSVDKNSLSGDLQHTGDTVSTDGIDITKLQVIVDNKGQAIAHLPDGHIAVDVSFWDFAGQELYYVTHQFFLSSRSIYLVLFDCRYPMEKSRVLYWLWSISGKVSEGAVYIIGTHLDALSDPEKQALTQTMLQARTQYRQTFPMLDISVTAISPREGIGMDNLKQKLEKLIIGQQNMGEIQPVAFYLLEQLIMEARQQYYPPIIDRTILMNYGRMCGLKTEQEVYELCRVLHNFGLIVYFDSDPLLSQLVIIDPSFLTNLMATFITTKHGWITGGVLKHGVLPQIWRPPEYPPTIHPHLLGILKRFEIAYEFPSLLAAPAPDLTPDPAEVLETPTTPAPDAKHDMASKQAAFSDAIFQKNEPEIKKFLDDPTLRTLMSGVNDRGQSPLYIACRSGNVPLVEKFLNFPYVDVNVIVEEHGGTPLHAAGAQKHLEVVALLLARGADKDKPNKAGITASQEATGTTIDVYTTFNSFGVPGLQGMFPNLNLRRDPERGILTRSGSALKARDKKARISRKESKANILEKVVNADRGAKVIQEEDVAKTSISFEFLTSENFNYNGQSIIPCLLNSHKPPEILKLWRSFPNPDEYEISRVFTFQFIPNGLFARMIVRLLTLYPITPEATTLFWHDGLFVQNPDHIFFLRQFISIKRVELSVRAHSKVKVERIYCSLIEAINNLLGEWKHMSVTFEIKCYSCLVKGAARPTYFSLSEVESLFLDGKTSIHCAACQIDIPFSDVVPDLQMVYFLGRKVTLEEFTMGKQLGVGGFATVYKGEFEGQVVAVKKLTKQKDDVDFQVAFQDFRKEIFAMSHIQSDYCVRLHAICMEPFCLLTEFIGCGDMYKFVHESLELEFTWTVRIKSALDIAYGLECMHTRIPAIMHLDLKTPNILMKSLDENDPIMAKVTDFGCSSTGEVQYTRLVDNPVWCAPEILAGSPYKKSVDVYGFGVILYELLTRIDFFGDIGFMSDLAEAVMKGERPELPTDCLPEFRTLLTSCWAQNSDDRPEFPKIVLDLESLQKKLPHLIALSKVLIWMEQLGDMQQSLIKNREPLSEIIFNSNEAVPLVTKHLSVKPQSFFKTKDLADLKDQLVAFVEQTGSYVPQFQFETPDWLSSIGASKIEAGFIDFLEQIKKIQGSKDLSSFKAFVPKPVVVTKPRSDTNRKVLGLGLNLSKIDETQKKIEQERIEQELREAAERRQKAEEERERLALAAQEAAEEEALAMIMAQEEMERQKEKEKEMIANAAREQRRLEDEEKERLREEGRLMDKKREEERRKLEKSNRLSVPGPGWTDTTSLQDSTPKATIRRERSCSIHMETAELEHLLQEETAPPLAATPAPTVQEKERLESWLNSMGTTIQKSPNAPKIAPSSVSELEAMLNEVVPGSTAGLALPNQNPNTAFITNPAMMTQGMMNPMLQQQLMQQQLMQNQMMMGNMGMNQMAMLNPMQQQMLMMQNQMGMLNPMQQQLLLQQMRNQMGMGMNPMATNPMGMNPMATTNPMGIGNRMPTNPQPQEVSRSQAKTIASEVLTTLSSQIFPLLVGMNKGTAPPTAPTDLLKHTKNLRDTGLKIGMEGSQMAKLATDNITELCTLTVAFVKAGPQQKQAAYTDVTATAKRLIATLQSFINT